MPASARATDLWIGKCCCHDKDHPSQDGHDCIDMGGFIVTGSPDAISSGKGQAAVGDLTIGWCGHTGIIITGSPNALVNNKGKATLGSQITGCNIGTVITGNPKHLIN